MSFSETLGNPGVGNALLLAAAIIGVFGSYCLYRIRLRDRKEAARRAIKAEIEETTHLDSWVKDSSNIPREQIQPTAAYEGHISNIGLLTAKEIELISGFYSSAILANDIMDWNRRLEMDLIGKGTDRNKRQREYQISRKLDHLAVQRWKVLQILKKQLGEEYEPLEKMSEPEAAGDMIHKDHPMVNIAHEKLLNEGYFEEVEDDSEFLRMTNKGEKWIKEGAKTTESELFTR